MNNRSPKYEILAAQLVDTNKRIDALFAKIVELKECQIEAKICVNILKAFIKTLPQYMSDTTVGSQRNASLLDEIAKLERVTEEVVNDRAKFNNELITRLPIISSTLALYVAEVQTQCELEFKRANDKKQEPISHPIPFSSRTSESTEERLVREMEQLSREREQRYFTSDLYNLDSPHYYRTHIQTVIDKILKRPDLSIQRSLGDIVKFREMLTALEYDKANSFVLESLPVPVKQEGPNCGYYAAAYVIAYWYKQSSAHQQYPARLCGQEDKKDGVSLKKLAKKKGIKGVGALYDVNLFASILEETDYHSQVVHFWSQDTFQKLILLALKHNLPLILPVDWVGGGTIGMNQGKNSHYITIVGCASHRDNKTVFFVSSTTFYQVSLSELFKSNDNLKITPAEIFVKKSKREGWSRMGAYIPQVTSDTKVYKEDDIDLKHLRNHAVLIYPKSMKSQYEALFQAAEDKLELSTYHEIKFFQPQSRSEEIAPETKTQGLTSDQRDLDMDLYS